MRLIFGQGKVCAIIRKDDDVVIPHSQCDVGDIDSVASTIYQHQPEVIINTAANTSLERCEDNKHEAFDTNTLGAINLLTVSAQASAKLVHISSGCIFDGNYRICTEESTPNTSVWYTHTKKWADEFIMNFGYENYLILRPRQMISATPHPTNMLTKFATYDEIHAHPESNSITCVEDFKEMLEHLVEQDERGVFNCCNDGVTTPYAVARGVQKFIKPEMIVHAATYEETLKMQPNRRVNTILSNQKLKNTGYTPRTAAEALAWTLENYGKS